MKKYFLLCSFFFAFANNHTFAQVNFVEHLVGTQADGPHFVGIADLDNDGDMDLVSSSDADSDLRLYFNNGNEVFTDNILTWVSASNLLFVDFEHDGDKDIFTTCGADGTISWFRNLGAGVFNTGILYNENSPRSTYLVMADIDNDNDLDIISAKNQGGSNLTWHENDSFNQFAAQQLIASNTNVERLAAIDMNNDNYPEIVTVSNGSVKWYANNAGNISSTGTTIDNTTSAKTVCVADINNDGFQDIVVGSWDFMKPLAWYQNNNGTGFGTFRLISNQFALIHDVKAGDMDGDGDLDIVGSDDFGGNKIVWFANNGSGTFGVLRTVKNGISSAHGIDLGDIDGDGDLDVAACGYANDQVLWYENQIPGASIQEANAQSMNLQAIWMPQTEQINLSFTATQNTKNARLNLYSIDGKQIGQQNIDIAIGQNYIQMPTNQVPNGIYLLQLQTAEQAATIKIMKK